jgi:hypothetical protein
MSKEVSKLQIGEVSKIAGNVRKIVPGRKQQTESGMGMFSVLLPADLIAAFEQACRINKIPRSAELRMALEEHLAKLGLWPLPASETDQVQDEPKKGRKRKT